MSQALTGSTVQLSVDESEKHELMGIQHTLNESRMAHEDLKQTLTRLKKQQQQFEVNRRTVSGLKDHQSTWVAVGKMFIKKSSSSILALIESDMAKIDKRIGEVELREQSILKTMKERQKTFDDFVLAHRVLETTEEKKAPPAF